MVTMPFLRLKHNIYQWSRYDHADMVFCLSTDRLLDAIIVAMITYKMVRGNYTSFEKET